MKDDALKALKRSARAILKDELKALRADIKQLRSANLDHLSQLHEAREEARRHARELYVLRPAYHDLKDRASRAVKWASIHGMAKGNRVSLCLAEWINNGTGGSGFGIVHPFDRWGIYPKP